MNSNYYFDIEIERAGVASSIPLPVVAGTIMNLLHRTFVGLGNHYAIALPEGERRLLSTIRIFSSDRTQLDTLVESIVNQSVIRDYAKFSYPLPVPKIITRWVTYRRFRIPSRKSDRNLGSGLRERRIQEAQDLPYFLIRSSSTGQTFSLHVEIVKNCSPPSAESFPDTYGLARTNTPFSVPDLP